MAEWLRLPVVEIDVVQVSAPYDHADKGLTTGQRTLPGICSITTA